jgi:hypothetical protein
MIDWGAMLADDAPPMELPAPPLAEQAQDEAPPDPSILAREAEGDNRRRCAECGNLGERGACLAAQRRQIKASRQYVPLRDILRRCEGFAALPGDPDQRPGRERWPGLIVDPQQAEAGQTEA